MEGNRELRLHTTRSTKPLESIGLAVVKAWIRATDRTVAIDDVHDNPAWFSKGVDLVLKRPGGIESIDLKVDSYFGTDPAKKARGLYNLDSGVLLIETTSQLRYDRADLDRHPDVPGWFFTSQADTIYYYFVAIETPAATLKPILARREILKNRNGAAELFERELIGALNIERDELLTYSLEKARKWYSNAPPAAFEGWAGAGNPGYVTVSKRLKRDFFLGTDWGKSHGSIIDIAKKWVAEQGRTVAGAP